MVLPKMEWKVVGILVAVIALYLTAGAFLFQYLEKRSEDPDSATTLRLGNFSRHFLAEHPNVTLTEEDLNQFLEDVMSAYNNGSLQTVPDRATMGSTWEFSDSFFFSGTVITTVGYGNIAPRTPNGRLAVMFYGLIGIPLCIVMLAGLGGKLGELGSSLDKRLLCLAHGSAKGCKLLRLAILVSIGWTLFLMFPAVLFTLTEGWTYLDSVYFAFITLSTVGFGDVVPARNNSHGQAMYRLFVTLWVFIGLAWLSLLIATLSDCIQTGITEGEAKMLDTIKHRVTKMNMCRRTSSHGSTSSGKAHSVQDKDIAAVTLTNEGEHQKEGRTKTNDTSGNTPRVPKATTDNVAHDHDQEA